VINGPFCFIFNFSMFKNRILYFFCKQSVNEAWVFITILFNENKVLFLLSLIAVFLKLLCVYFRYNKNTAEIIKRLNKLLVFFFKKCYRNLTFK